MSKESHPLEVSVTTSLGTTEPVVWSDQLIGRIIVPSGATVTSLTFYESIDENGTYVQCADVDALTVAAGKSYRMPIALCGSRYIKIVGNAAVTLNVICKA